MRESLFSLHFGCDAKPDTKTTLHWKVISCLKHRFFWHKSQLAQYVKLYLVWLRLCVFEASLNVKISIPETSAETVKFKGSSANSSHDIGRRVWFWLQGGMITLPQMILHCLTERSCLLRRSWILAQTSGPTDAAEVMMSVTELKS